MRSYWQENYGDDLFYAYILDETLVGNPQEEYIPITNLADALHSQYHQYFGSNGRLAVHVLVQMFCGPWGLTAWSIFEALLMAAVLATFMAFTVGRRKMLNPMMWLLFSAAMLYLFPAHRVAWYKINVAMNYLFPMLPTLIYLFLWRRYSQNTIKPPKTTLAALATFAFIAGWMQDVYSVPLSGGTFLLLAWQYFKHKRIDRTLLWLAIPLWVGTIILEASPGNFSRAQDTFPPLINVLMGGFEMLVANNLFWATLAALALLLLIKGKTGLRTFLKENGFLFLVLLTSVCFGMVAHSTAHSFIGISFFSSLILFKILALFPFPGNRNLAAISCLSLALFGIMCFHQSRIIKTSAQLQKIHHNLITDYIYSTDGVVQWPDIELAPDVNPYAYNWYDNCNYNYPQWSIMHIYGNRAKRMFILGHQDWQAYAGGQTTANFLATADTVPSAPCTFYRGRACIWTHRQNIAALGDSICIRSSEVSQSPVRQYIRRLLNKKPLKVTETIAVTDTNIIEGRGNLVGLQVSEPFPDVNEVTPVLKNQSKP